MLRNRRAQRGKAPVKPAPPKKTPKPVATGSPAKRQQPKTTKSGQAYMVKLGNGNLSLDLSADIFSLSIDEMKFVKEIFDQLKAFEASQGGKDPTQSSS